MRALRSKLDGKRVSVAKAKADAKYARMVAAEPSPHAYASPSGATSAAVKTHDQETQALIDAALKARGLKA